MTDAYHGTDAFAEFGLRAVALWAQRGGATVRRVDSLQEYSRQGIDLLVERGGSGQKIKVRTDSYYGTNESAIDDHDLPFYRRRADDLALETISHHITREPGWMFNSEADQLWYYQAVLMNTREELERALSLEDGAMIAEVDIEADRLRTIPMPPLRAWFDGAHVNYPPRPVQTGDHLAWFRIIPEADAKKAVGTVETQSKLFGHV